MRAGFGAYELTPPLGVELAGFGYYINRRALSVNDPLFARAVYIEYGDMRGVIISCDVLGLSKAVCEKVFVHAEALGICRDNVIIVSVHTHCGPAIKYHEGCGYTDERYIATVGPAICHAFDAAIADAADVSRLSHNCVPYAGNHIYNRADPDGPVDRTVRGFMLERALKPPIAMVSAACHGVFRGRATAISADFSGEICRILDASGMHSIYLNGLCGDIDPTVFSDDNLGSYARLIAESFRISPVEIPATLAGGRLGFTLRLTPVTADDIHAAAEEAVRRAGGADMPAARVALIWESEMLAKLDSLSDTEDISIKYLLLGGVPIAALPFEGFTRIGMDIRNISGREDAMVLGCAEELLGYLPTKDDIRRGAYAALESTFLYKRLPVVPGEAERLGIEVGNLLKKVL